MQFPEIGYFAYYLARCVLARENTSNSTNLDLAIMLAVVDRNYTYSIGAQIARRVSNNASRGPYFGGIIASRILFSQSVVSVEPDNDLMLPEFGFQCSILSWFLQRRERLWGFRL